MPRWLAITTLVPMRQFLSTMAPSMHEPAPIPSSGWPGKREDVRSLVLVGSHQDRIADRHVIADDASQADDAVLDHDARPMRPPSADQALRDLSTTETGRRQKTRPRIDRAAGHVQLERRLRLGQRQVALVEGLDRPDVFPIPIEQMDLDPAAADGCRKDFAAEILVVGLGQHIHQVSRLKT